MVLTSNQSFGAWGEVFGDHVILVRPHDDSSTQPGGQI